jgi:hypothetical protein
MFPSPRAPQIAHRIEIAGAKGCVGFSGEVEIVGSVQDMNARKIPSMKN